jgi:hypothetical protein
MKPITVLVASVLMTTWLEAQSGPKSPAVQIFSYEDTSCGAWMSSANNPPVRAQYYSWFRGFVSGYNWGNPNNQVLRHMPDLATLSLYVDKYCREQPLQSFDWAANRSGSRTS